MAQGLFGVNKRRQLSLRTKTFAEFDNGWNVRANDLNLDPSFGRRMINVSRAPDGSVQVRYGTRLFANLEEHIDRVVGMRYYNSKIIVVGTNGNIVGVDQYGNVMLLWDEALARIRTSNTAGKWIDVTRVAFAEFNGELVVVDGTHKPLLVPSNFAVRYLVDIPSQSNANTPIAPYVVTHGRYLVMGSGRTLYISNLDSSGTWSGDAASDGVNIDLGSRLETGELGITGLASFRDRLIIQFANAMLIGQLGVYASAVHTPTLSDPIEQFGTAAHNTISAIGDDVLFLDRFGVPSLARTLFTGVITPSRVSQFIDPEIIRQINKNSVDSLQERAFAILDRNESQYMLFIPNDQGRDAQTESRGFIYTNIKQLKVSAWSEFRGWNWRAATRSALGKVFFADDQRIFEYGSIADPINKDFVGDQEMWADDTAFEDNTGWTPVADEADSGLSIYFDWEWPWNDLGLRDSIKYSKHIKIDTRGTARFTAEMYIDNILLDNTDVGESWTDETVYDDGFGWAWYDLARPLDPALSMDFVGGDRLGFGLETPQSEFGGGRISSDEREYAWPTKFKLMKMRFTGYADAPLQFVSVTMNFIGGTIRR